MFSQKLYIDVENFPHFILFIWFLIACSNFWPFFLYENENVQYKMIFDFAFWFFSSYNNKFIGPKNRTT